MTDPHPDPAGPAIAEPERREPRFVFLSDARPNGSRGERPTGTVIRYGWRLDAANHRPLGRSGGVATSLDVCKDWVHRLRNDFDQAKLTVAAVSNSSRWSWRLVLGGEVVAVCTHGFARRAECLRGYTHFVEALHAARPDAGVVRCYGPRALVGFDIDLAVDSEVRR